MEICNNGVDDTGNGLIDCEDPTCEQAENCLCGNGVLDVGEACDDGNTLGNDGCSPTCQFEGTSCVEAIQLNAHPTADPVTWVFQIDPAGRPDSFNAVCATTSNSPDVHVRFTAPTSGAYWLEFDTGADAVFTLLHGDCSQLECIDDNRSPGEEAIWLELAANQELVLVLDAWFDIPNVVPATLTVSRFRLAPIECSTRGRHRTVGDGPLVPAFHFTHGVLHPYRLAKAFHS